LKLGVIEGSLISSRGQICIGKASSTDRCIATPLLLHNHTHTHTLTRSNEEILGGYILPVQDFRNTYINLLANTECLCNNNIKVDVIIIIIIIVISKIAYPASSSLCLEFNA
jgi:hypothetical protein